MKILQNDPSLWRGSLPASGPNSHKYERGVAVIYGAPKMTGATRLAARACARMGAGLVKVIAPAGTGEIYRTTLHEEIIVVDEADFTGFDDPKIRAVLLGPGCPPDELYRELFHKVIKAVHIKGLVMDAGAFMSWDTAIQQDLLRSYASPDRVVVTPHEGEFKALFERSGSCKDISRQDSKAARAQKAASEINSTVVLKGAMTVIADGAGAIVNDRDVPALATAGTGDVLAGMITGLIAQGMDVRLASAAAVWIHAEAGARFGMGMVASDLPEMIPEILQAL